MVAIDLHCPTVQLIIAIFVTFILTVITFIRFYCYITLGRCHSKRKMDGKVVLITGANGGIGKETAKNLAKRGAKLILACRNLDAANKVKGKFSFFFFYFVLFKKNILNLVFINYYQ